MICFSQSNFSFKTINAYVDFDFIFSKMESGRNTYNEFHDFTYVANLGIIEFGRLSKFSKPFQDCLHQWLTACSSWSTKEIIVVFQLKANLKQIFPRLYVLNFCLFKFRN